MINYRGTPLFGDDSSVSHTSEFFAIVGTVLFWLLFLIFSFVIKVEPKKQYKEVQIVLSSTPVVEKTVESPAPAEQAAASSASSEPVVEKVVEPPAPASASKPVEQNVETPAPKKVETPKPKTTAPQKTQQTQKQPAPKTTPAPKTSEPVTYAVDPMEAFAAQTKQQPKKEFDWSQFDDDEADDSSSSNQTKTVQNNSPAFLGSAGTAAADSASKVTSSSTSNNSTAKATSAATSSALEGIRNSTYKGTASNGVQSETNVKTKNSGSGRVEMEMLNGKSRALIKPASPVINLSSSAAATVDTSKTVIISFTVLEGGNVIEIKITPESILASIVRDEIKQQISAWQFEPADYASNATFEYKIIKK